MTGPDGDTLGIQESRHIVRVNFIVGKGNGSAAMFRILRTINRQMF